MSGAMRIMAIALGVAAAATGCKRPPQEYSGIGPWNVTRTTRGHVTGGRCDPTDLPGGRKGTYCYLQPMLPVADQAAEVDVYFGGTEPSARLIELQLKVKICDADKTDGWLRTNFGLPYES